jgi:hypothetical protein
MYISEKENLAGILKFKSDGVRESKTLDWYSSDSKENFETNIKSTPDVYSFYKNYPIKYEFNNHGFRTPDDFNSTDEGNVFLGCSHTAGVGTQFDNTWVSRIDSHTIYKDYKCYNLGVPAASTGTMFRLLFYYKDILKIKNVFHYSLLSPRYELFYDKDDMDKHWEYFGSYLNDLKQENKEFPHDNFIMNSFLSDEYKMLDQLKNFLAIKQICNTLGINYYLATESLLEKWIKKKKTWFNRYSKKNELSFIPARDGAHMATDKHFMLAHYFTYLINDGESVNIDLGLYGL